MLFAPCLKKLNVEHLDWIKMQFKDWALTFITSAIFYDDKAPLTGEQKQLYLRRILVYDGIAPTYHMALKEDKHVLV